MPQSRQFTLPDGLQLPWSAATADDSPAALAQALGGAGGPLLLLAGGDDEIDPALLARLTQVVARGLVRTLRDLAAQSGRQARCLVRASGAGLPSLLGQAVAEGGGPLQLLGVGPEGLLAAGGADQPAPGLSQLITWPGQAWGDTLRARFDLAQALAGPGARPLVLLIGGGNAAVAEVLQAVRRGWPVLMLEGSGGAADALVRQFQSGEAEGDDPVLAEILADGVLASITLGDKAAGAVAALARALQREFGGDSVLRLAWQRFGALDAAAKSQQTDFGKLQAWVLVLGVVLVGLSVLHTVGTAHQVDMSWLRYVLIVMPILVSVLIAIGNRFSPGKRWVLARAAAESLKREIYRYRVRPRRAVADGLREKRLQQAMEDITRRLARTEVNGMGMPPYQGPVPPLYAAAEGDDGMGLLDVDRYVRLRLTDQLTYYAGKTAKLDRQARSWQVAAIVVGALGTLLAALGTATLPWVALTSALASAAMAFLGYKQFETTLTSYNQTATDLQNLHAWWTALLPDEQAMAENVDKLVDTTEKVLGDEQDGWAQNMKNALETLRDRQTQEEAERAEKAAKAEKLQAGGPPAASDAPDKVPPADNVDPAAPPQAAEPASGEADAPAPPAGGAGAPAAADPAEAADATEAQKPAAPGPDNKG